MDTSAVTVLLIEDNAGDAGLLKLALAKTEAQFHVCWVTCLADALQRLRSETFDVVLADLSLPDSQGLAGVRAIRRTTSEVAIVVLTSLSSDRVALDALDEGAQDYLTKDSVTPDVLERAIRYAIQRQKNAEMRKLLDKVQASEQLLERKNKRLARLYRLAQRFVDNVSHEFRTPLTVVMEYISMLREGLVGELNEQQRRMLDISADRADDLNNMVNDMLDVSKLSAGIMGLCRGSHRMEEIIEHVRPNLEKKAAIKGVVLDIILEAELPQVYCDPEKIGRVLINLAVNAIKFSGRPGHVQIRIGRDSATADLGVAVSDDGPGIDARRLGELFKRFKQLGAQPRGSTKGFGLGLSIAKELVHLNFGRISVESQLGAGSTFSFTVPVDDPLEVTRRYLRQAKRGSRELSLVEAVLDASVPATLADDVDAFLNCLLRRHDVVFRADGRRWLLLLAASADEVELFLARAYDVFRDTNRNRPYEPLPETSLSRIGTWPIQNETQEILSAVEGVLKTAEVTHA